MRTSRIIHTVDSPTEGMLTRVITGGVGVVPGETMAEKRQHFIEHLDDPRKLLTNEPRGHASMGEAILQPSTRADADYGVLFIEVAGLLPMCGHGTVGTATVLVETGMVPVQEPVTTVRLDTPASLVTAEVPVENGRVTSVTIKNVPSFSHPLNQMVTIDGHGLVPYDIAFGRSFYAIVDLAYLGIPLARERKKDLIAAGLAVMDASNTQNRPVHPERPDIAGCHHVYLKDPSFTAEHSKHATATYPAWFDCSPCGTGTRTGMGWRQGRICGFATDRDRSGARRDRGGARAHKQANSRRPRSGGCARVQLCLKP